MEQWTRIPAEVKSETDRRDLTAILSSLGLAVRIVRVKKTPNGTAKKDLKQNGSECPTARFARESALIRSPIER